MSVNSKIEDAIKMRREGKSIKGIAKTLSCSSSSVSRWTKDIVLSKEQRENLAKRAHGEGKYMKASLVYQENCRNLREGWRDEGRQKALIGDFKHSMFCSLYWAEGAKSINSLVFANTDPMMIKFFYSYLIENFNVEPKINFVYHPEDGEGTEENSKKFWCELLGLPLEKVQPKKNIDKRIKSGKKKNRHKHGMCCIVANSTHLVQHIYGALEVYGETFLCKK